MRAWRSRPAFLPAFSGRGRGFGEAAFRAGRALAGVALLLGLVMVGPGDGAVASAGGAVLALGGVAVLTAGLGLLAERAIARRDPPPDLLPHLDGHRPR